MEAVVNYVCNPPAPGGAALEFVTEAEAESTMRTEERSVEIVDARMLGTSLEVEGFELVAHASAVEDFDRVEVDPTTDQRYCDEIAELLRRHTGADRVVMLGGGKKRFGERAVDELDALTNAKPARYPHGDNTDESAEGLAEFFAAVAGDLDLDEYPRWAMYNVWRCVTAPPQDVPLAVCDARSIAAEHEVTVTAVTELSGGFVVRHDTTSYVFDPAHRWYHFPDMTPDEVLVFKSHDTDRKRARRVPHTAFDHPDTPPGTPTRASIEARGLALFR